MIIHTLVFSFSDSMPEAERNQFFAEMDDVILKSGLAEKIDHKPHLRLPDDDYAPVFVSSAIAEISVQDLPTLQKLTVWPQLNEFREKWQAKYPYKVIWTNHERLTV
ncbi:MULTISPECIES: hypothetical protein [Streptomyces]|uniref:hypothetical protein n=1 Tax=Streptomyces TaxID=1883 RepID=UPI00163BD75E|nr:MULTISPECIES: hypothetical protein [Streptomyces]MBC2876907.1 hypothetical protein [Streptomyces sp. TYQ1024]UBI35934.1 hypothetical protein K7I03_05295 [Streptomyces mobaraensis]UKW28527.1 hypothetical protein MCU78_05295 [Streptomyces sp. TYQ1024]